jgi:uncharacterized alkaline shock family protein YloU
VETVALVGPAGSGKSHRASLVAHDHHCDAIIDDGLLILVKSGKIVAGSSAKREDNKMAAVKRAIFVDPDHRAEVHAAIRKQKPQRILVLGTSDDMIVRICDALDIPHPDVTVRIEDIASPAQIRLARRKRLQEGKHVIPAPTLEVKRSFSGYMVDPLHFLMRRSDDEVSVEKSVVRPTFSSLGKFFIADTVLSLIAEKAATEAEGISRVNKVLVDTSREGVSLEMEVCLRYGCHVWDTLRTAQAAVKERIEHMTALNVLSVDLHARRMTID